MTSKQYLLIAMGLLALSFMTIIILVFNIRRLSKTNMQTKYLLKRLAYKYNIDTESGKEWENELIGLVKTFIRNIDLNHNIYLGALLARQRGYNIDGLDHWLANPLKNEMYCRLEDEVLNSLPKGVVLSGLNEFDNIAQILCASVYNDKLFDDVMCNSLNTEDITKIINVIKKKNMKKDLAKILAHLKHRYEQLGSDTYETFKCVIFDNIDVSEHADIELMEKNIMEDSVRDIAEFETANKELMGVIISLVKQKEIRI